MHKCAFFTTFAPSKYLNNAFMKRFCTLFLLLISFAYIHAIGTNARCDYYQVDAKKLVLYEDSTLAKVQSTVLKGNIIEVTYSYPDTTAKGDIVWRARQYVPDSLHAKYKEKGHSVTFAGYVKIDKTNKLKSGYFAFTDDLQITPIDPPDRKAVKQHKLAQFNRFWSYIYEPALGAIFLFCIVLLIVSLFHIKFLRILCISVLSVFFLLWFYGKHADTYFCGLFLASGIFMPLAYANLLLPWKRDLDLKKGAVGIMVILATLVAIVVTFIYLHIIWNGWFWAAIVSLVAGFIAAGLVTWAGSTDDDVCPHCGYYGRQDQEREEILEQWDTTEYQTTEYRNRYSGALHHTETTATDIRHTKKRHHMRCRKCGGRYSYVATSSIRGIGRRTYDY